MTDIGEYLNEDEIYALTEESLDAPSRSPDDSQSSNFDFRMERFPHPSTLGEDGPQPPSSLMVREDGRSRTGPKGVLDDFRASQQAVRNIKMRDQIAREREISRQIGANVQLHTSEGKQLSDDDLSDIEDEDDREAFRHFATQRLSLIRASQESFGSYERIESRAKFASLVHALTPTVYSVCHVYDNSVETCARLHFALESLAQQFDTVKFVRLRREDGFHAFPLSGLPALLVYRGSELVHTALRVGEVLGRNFTDADVARLLQSKGILAPSAPIETLKQQFKQLHVEDSSSSQRTTVRKSKVARNDSSDDSDDD